MKKRVLFLCTENACRSQMAEGLLRFEASDQFEVFSAGSKATAVNPLAITVMGELGIDISGHRSKSLEEFKDKEFDFVVAVCSRAGAICPVFSGEHQKFSWDIEDPGKAQGTHEERLIVFRKIRDVIQARVKQFILQAS